MTTEWTHTGHVYLLGELFLTQLVEHIELAGQVDVLNEPDTGQLHSDDDVSVRHHHGHGTEVDLQVLRQLLTPSVPRVLQTHVLGHDRR